jgi:hypothetical protein
MFGPKVVGVSLAAACRMRFQRGKGERRQVAEVTRHQPALRIDIWSIRGMAPVQLHYG